MYLYIENKVKSEVYEIESGNIVFFADHPVFLEGRIQFRVSWRSDTDPFFCWVVDPGQIHPDPQPMLVDVVREIVRITTVWHNQILI